MPIPVAIETVQADPRVLAHTTERNRNVRGRGGWHSCDVAHPSIEGDGVVLRTTTDEDLGTLVTFFTDPGFYDRWGGQPVSDAEIAAKYLGRRSPAVECFIVEEAGRPIGFVQYYVADDEAGTGGMDLVLAPNARGRGVGTAVVNALAKFVSSELLWRSFRVDPDVSNSRGVNFWTKVGFEPVRIIEDEHDREPYWLMEWPISTSVTKTANVLGNPE